MTTDSFPDSVADTTAVGFDPARRTWTTTRMGDLLPVPGFTGRLRVDDQTLVRAADDWGGVVHHRPAAVLEPGSIQDIEIMVRFAAEHRLPLAARGGGHSCYGQGQTGGVVIDMATLPVVHEITSNSIVVGAGTSWNQVLAHTLPHGLTPPVLTDYLQTSVGGTLSVGGIGGATHRYGMQTDAVLALDVVTATGDLLTCSPTHNQHLFDAVRAGLGQCGIIVRATVRLMPAPSHTRRYLLRYPNLASYLADHRRLVGDGRFQYLEGQIVDAEDGGWQPLLETAAFYTPPGVPNDAALLADLAYLRGAEDIEELTYWDFLNRVATGEELLRATGEWFHPHAWANLFLPDAVIEQFAATALRGLSRANIGDTGLILLYPFRTQHLRTPLLRTPNGRTAWLFAVLRTSDPQVPGQIDEMITASRLLYERAIASGGMAYPINTFPMTPADWQSHFGPRWHDLVEAKYRYDPNWIMAPGQGLFTVP
jgi:cytokinin dehydrogenase